MRLSSFQKLGVRVLKICLASILSAYTVATSAHRFLRNFPAHNVAVIGGTHGNEFHGVYIVRELCELPFTMNLKSVFPSVSIQAMIGNPAAVATIGMGSSRRYCDEDLNRCFLKENLADNSLKTIEALRAKEINELLGPKSFMTPRCDFIFDLHSSTSNTGILLTYHPQDDFALKIASYLHYRGFRLSVAQWSDAEAPFVASVSRSGLVVEVGPIAHSTFNSELYQETKALLYEAFNFIEMHNNWCSSCLGGSASSSRSDDFKRVEISLPVYKRIASVGYPRNRDGQITALVHRRIQGAAELNGGCVIRKGDAIFENLKDGSSISFQGLQCDFSELPYRVDLASSSGGKVGISPDESYGTILNSSQDYSLLEEDAEEIYWPMFINEAAYLEKDIAFHLMSRTQRTVSIAVKA